MFIKKKDRSAFSPERDPSYFAYDGSTGMNIGFVKSSNPQNPLAKAMEVIGGVSLSPRQDRTFDYGGINQKRKSMTQKFMNNFKDTDDEDSVGSKVRTISPRVKQTRRSSPKKLQGANRTE